MSPALTWKVLFSLLLIALTFTAELKVHAQTHEPKFRLLEGADGITFGKINDMVRDQYGVIWFVDQSNGLIRYDGTHITVYPHDMQNPNSLGGPNPESLLIDKSGNIWISFWGTGLDKFDPETSDFTHYRHQPNDPATVSNDSISAILIDHLGNFWVGTNQGLDLLDQQTGKFKHYKHDPKELTSLSFNLVRSLYEDREGTVWIGTGMAWETHTKGGLNKFNRDTENFTRYLHDPNDPQSLINNKVRAMFEDSKGNFWVGTAGDGLHSMDRNTGKFTRHLNNPKNPDQLARPPLKYSSGDHITFITEDVEGQLWIGTWDNGINRYNPSTKEITYFGNNSGGLADSNPWIAKCFDDGLFWLSMDVPSAKLYQIDLFTNNIPFIPVSGAYGVNRFFQDEPGKLWLATEGGGLIIKDLTTQQVQTFRHDPNNPKSISSDNLATILKTRNGHYWIGANNGLNHFDRKTGTFTRYQHDVNNKESIINASIYSLYEDQQNNIWICALGGLDKFDTKTGKFTHYVRTDDTSGLGGDMVIDILEDKPDELWVTAWNGGGINRLNAITGKFKHYLKGVNVGRITKDRSGVIWVATGSGLFRYNRDTDRFSLVNFSETRGMNEEIRTIALDQSDRLWLATSKNIVTLNKENTISHSFGKDNQLSKIIWYLTAYNTRDNQLLFGTDGGYYSINSSELKSNPMIPKINFTDFSIGNELLNSNHDNTSKSSVSLEEIELGYAQNIFSIGFSVIDYSHSARKVFYKLDGYDLNWRQPGSEVRAYYFNIPPGKYTFTVKANNDSNTNWQEKKITITISPPWWRTWWAYGSFGVLFIGLVFSVDRFQRSRLLKRAEAEAKEKELAQAKEIEKAYTELKATQSQLIQSEKMASLGELTAGIAHEIQNPLNFVNNFSEVNSELIAELKEEISKGNLEEVKNIANTIDENEKKIIFHGKRADGIVKGMLQHSRSSSGVKEPTDINALADEYLRLAYHGLRAKDKSFNASMKTDFDEQIGKINVVPQDIGRVILNLITNAFYVVAEKKQKSTEGYEPTVTVSTKKINDTIEIRVKDNGNGIPQKVLEKIFQPFFTTKPAGQGTGLGLSMSYDIVTKAHNGEIKVETKEGEGTEFIVVLPM